LVRKGDVTGFYSSVPLLNLPALP